MKDIQSYGCLRNNMKNEEDKFIVKMFETLKQQFPDENIFYGKTIKFIIDGMITRMKCGQNL